MSETSHIICDGCGKDVLIGQNAGWIRINCSVDYSVDLVLDESPEDLKSDQLATKQLDFCSSDCLKDWAEKETK